MSTPHGCATPKGLNPKQAGDRRTSSVESGRRTSSTTYINFDKFDVQIENGRAPGKHLRSWEDMEAVDTEERNNLAQCVEWYGWKAPTKFQGVAIPAMQQAAVKVSERRTFTMLQAQPACGKTSALALGLLTCVKRQGGLQAVVFAKDAGKEVERYLTMFGVLSPLRAEIFEEPQAEESGGFPQADVRRATQAHVLLGHPERISALLHSGGEALQLEEMSLFMMDDAAELITAKYMDFISEVNHLICMATKKPVRYVILSHFLAREARPLLRNLKSSLLHRKNMFDLSTQVSRIKKSVKHYIVEAAPEKWLQAVLRLRDIIYIPKAVLFCDDQKLLAKHAKGLVSDLKGGILENGKPKERAEKLNAFGAGKLSFLVTRSEIGLFQISMPRVFWILHWGVEKDRLAHYGCRLLCLDQSLRKGQNTTGQDGVSVLFLKPGEGSLVGTLERQFGIKFTRLPFDVVV